MTLKRTLALLLLNIVLMSLIPGMSALKLFVLAIGIGGGAFCIWWDWRCARGERT